jgi:hypothetical protein
MVELTACPSLNEVTVALVAARRQASRYTLCLSKNGATDPWVPSVRQPAATTEPEPGKSHLPVGPLALIRACPDAPVPARSSPWHAGLVLTLPAPSRVMIQVWQSRAETPTRIAEPWVPSKPQSPRPAAAPAAGPAEGITPSEVGFAIARIAQLSTARQTYTIAKRSISPVLLAELAVRITAPRVTIGHCFGDETSVAERSQFATCFVKLCPDPTPEVDLPRLGEAM